MLLITGEPGIGKSALASAIVEDASACGFTIASGRALAPEQTSAPPWLPLSACLRGIGIARALLPVDPQDVYGFWEDALAALGQASQRAPVLWLLEDLHDAIAQLKSADMFAAPSTLDSTGPSAHDTRRSGCSFALSGIRVVVATDRVRRRRVVDRDVGRQHRVASRSLPTLALGRDDLAVLSIVDVPRRMSIERAGLDRAVTRRSRSRRSGPGLISCALSVEFEAPVPSLPNASRSSVMSWFMNMRWPAFSGPR